MWNTRLNNAIHLFAFLKIKHLVSFIYGIIKYYYRIL